LGTQALPIGETDLDLSRAINDMMGCQDVSLGVNDEARSTAVGWSLGFTMSIRHSLNTNPNLNHSRPYLFCQPRIGLA
jgi:hypothetical protein